MDLKELGDQIRNCTKCRLSETRKHALPGEGKQRSKMMLIAQAPGEKEDEQGKMFVGPSGEVLHDIFDKLKIKERKIYMTNLVKCMLPDYRRPREDEIETCSDYLLKEIDLIDPETLIPMGFYATRFIFRRFLDSDLDRPHYPQNIGKLKLGRDNRKILPLPHPVTVIYHPEKRGEVETLYEKIKVLQRPCRWHKSCPMRKFAETGRIDMSWRRLYCHGDWSRCTRFLLEEQGIYHPDCMLPDGSIKIELRN